jgi:hypothetical protein
VNRRLTLSEARWPNTEDFAKLAARWRQDASERLLSIVWAGYDQLRMTVLEGLDWTRVGDDLERTITQLLLLCIQKCMTGKEPFYPQHGFYEAESRLAAPAQPPMYDIAFVWLANPRIMWPLEAKVLRSELAVSEYIRELNENFLSCRYAPFCGEGAMLAYLLAGRGSRVLEEISVKLELPLRGHETFPLRDHGISEHTRLVPLGKEYVAEFRCHHLVMAMRLSVE